MTINEMKIGQSASISKTVTETDVYLFAGISGDLNPAHTNEVAASKTMFKTRIAHGMLGASFISAAIGMQLPGPGTIYVGQDLKFTAPVHIGDTVTATVTVTELNVEKNRAILETVLTNQDGVVAIKGQAVVMPPKVK
ncbi:MAG: MaoC family dehydratase [Treponema sp.]